MFNMFPSLSFVECLFAVWINRVLQTPHVCVSLREHSPVEPKVGLGLASYDHPSVHTVHLEHCYHHCE